MDYYFVVKPKGGGLIGQLPLQVIAHRLSEGEFSDDYLAAPAAGDSYAEASKAGHLKWVTVAELVKNTSEPGSLQDVPTPRPDRPAPKPVAESNTTHGSSVTYGGVESSLESWGLAFVVTCSLAGIVCIIAAGSVNKKYSVDSWGERGLSWYLVGLGVGVILQGLFVRVLLNAGAEVIRLLRKLSNK